ncbi:unnamed protein product [Alopecurus aequalis]
MAAAPAEVLSPAKRRKQDTSCPESSPVFPAIAAAGWYSLPDDLVRRIAESFLVTNDIDCYVDLRAVCPSWRRATDDRKKDTSDPRFQPSSWIVLDQVSQSDNGTQILLNTVTGRFLRRKLPLLLDYHVVTTGGGFFVLADRSPPHAARVFNSLTGHMIPFVEPVPPDARVAFVGGTYRKPSSLGLPLLLLGDSSRKLYTSGADTQGFCSQECQQGVYNFVRKLVVGGAYPYISGMAYAGVFAELCDFMRSPHTNFVKFFSTDLPEDETDTRIDIGTGKLELVQGVGNFAIFIGHRRCLGVDANEFPGIEASCVYYTEHLGSSAHICKCNMEDYKVERISQVPEFVRQDKQFVLVADRPFTLIQLLCS